MAINDIINDQWQGHTHGEVEVALKDKLQELADLISQAAAAGIGLNRLTDEVKDLINTQADWSATSGLAYIKNKPDVVTGIKVGTNGQTQTPTNGVVVLPEPSTQVTIDTQLAESDNPVTNRAIKAAIDSLTNALNTLIGSGNVQGAIDTFNEVVAFLNGINSSDTLAAKLAQIATDIATKANDNAVVKTISVNGGTPATPVNGNVNISVEGGGSVDSITVGDHTYTPDVNGDVDLGDLRGQDGNSGVASADGVESVNNLNGGTTDTQSKVYVLGANQGKRLRDQIDLIYQRLQTLYSLLGNIAFWDGKPSQATLLPNLYWGNPMHTVTLDLDLTNAAVTVNGTQVSDEQEIQVEEGSTLTLIVSPASNCALSAAPTVTIDSDSYTPTSNGDGTYTIEVTMGQADMDVSIEATGESAYSISFTGTNCSKTGGDTSIISGGTASISIEAESGYVMPESLSSGAVTGASYTYTRDSQDNTKATIALSTPTDNVAIAVTATQVQTEQVNLTMKKVTAYGAQYGTAGNGDTAANTYKVPMTLANLNGSAPECSLSNTSYIDGQAFSATVIPATGYAIYSVKVMQSGNNITGTAYNPATRAISVASPDSSLAITVIVAAATNGMFKAGSLYGCRSGNQSDVGESSGGTQLSGQIVTDPNWHCNSEFISIPQGTTHVKWWVSDAEHKPYSQNQNGGTVLCQRSMNFLDEDLIPIAFLTYWEAANPYRILDMTTNQALSAAKFLRASYVEGYGKIEFSSDGTNFTTEWEYTEE